MTPRDSKYFKTHVQLRFEAGKRMKWLRLAFLEALGVTTQRKWAEVLRVDQADVSRWESGQQFPAMVVLWDINAITNVEPSFILFGFTDDLPRRLLLLIERDHLGDPLLTDRQTWRHTQAALWQRVAAAAVSQKPTRPKSRKDSARSA